MIFAILNSFSNCNSPTCNSLFMHPLRSGLIRCHVTLALSLHCQFPPKCHLVSQYDIHLASLKFPSLSLYCKSEQNVISEWSTLMRRTCWLRLDRMCTIYRTIITEPFDISPVVFLNSRGKRLEGQDAKLNTLSLPAGCALFCLVLTKLAMLFKNSERSKTILAYGNAVGRQLIVYLICVIWNNWLYISYSEANSSIKQCEKWSAKIYWVYSNSWKYFASCCP